MFYGRIVVFLFEFLGPLPLSEFIKKCLDDVKLKARQELCMIELITNELVRSTVIIEENSDDCELISSNTMSEELQAGSNQAFFAILDIEFTLPFFYHGLLKHIKF